MTDLEATSTFSPEYEKLIEKNAITQNNLLQKYKQFGNIKEQI
jgi:hypothetical protein